MRVAQRTSSFVVGLVVPIPTLPFARAVIPPAYNAFHQLVKLPIVWNVAGA